MPPAFSIRCHYIRTCILWANCSGRLALTLANLACTLVNNKVMWRTHISYKVDWWWRHQVFLEVDWWWRTNKSVTSTIGAGGASGYGHPGGMRMLWVLQVVLGLASQYRACEIRPKRHPNPNLIYSLIECMSFLNRVTQRTKTTAQGKKTETLRIQIDHPTSSSFFDCITFNLGNLEPTMMSFTTIINIIPRMVNKLH